MKYIIILIIIIFLILSYLIFYKYYLYKHIDNNFLQIWKNKSNILPRFTTIQYVKTLNCVIGACAKDIEKYLSKSINTMEKIGNIFKSYTIIVYENDSIDKTSDILIKWSDKNSNVHIITEKNVKGNRTVRLAHGRNSVLDKISKLNLNPDIYVVVDMDDKMISNYKNIYYCFDNSINDDWVVIGGNSGGAFNFYYDYWALRTYDNWIPYDHMLFNYSNYNKYILKNTQPIKVKSCFNGIVIYKYPYIKDSRYRGYYTTEFNGKYRGRDICEHVPFHLDILEKNKDKSIYINPKLII